MFRKNPCYYFYIFSNNNIMNFFSRENKIQTIIFLFIFKINNNIIMHKHNNKKLQLILEKITYIADGIWSIADGDVVAVWTIQLVCRCVKILFHLTNFNFLMLVQNKTLKHKIRRHCDSSRGLGNEITLL